MKAKKHELMSREGVVLDWTLDIHARAEGTKHSRTRESSQYLIIEGDFSEALNGVTKFLLQVHAAPQPDLGARDMPCVGSVIQVKPKIQAVGTLTPEEFQSLLMLAGSGNLRSFTMVFQKPHYGHALIASLSFSSRSPEGDWSPGFPRQLCRERHISTKGRDQYWNDVAGDVFRHPPKPVHGVCLGQPGVGWHLADSPCVVQGRHPGASNQATNNKEPADREQGLTEHSGKLRILSNPAHRFPPFPKSYLG